MDLATRRPDEVLEITRTFSAPAALVYRMWVAPEHLVGWLPDDVMSKGCEVDFRVGGRWSQTYGSDENPNYHHNISGVFREIDVPRRLVMTYVNDYDGIETLVTVNFRELGDGRTEMRFRQEGFQSLPERDGHGRGWSQGFDALAAYLLRLGSIETTPAGRPAKDGVSEDIAAAKQRDEDSKAGRA